MVKSCKNSWEQTDSLIRRTVPVGSTKEKVQGCAWSKAWFGPAYGYPLYRSTPAESHSSRGVLLTLSEHMFSASCLQNVCFHLVSSSCDMCDYCNHLRMGGTPCGDGVNMVEDSLPIQFVQWVRIAHKTPSLDSPVLFHREAVSFPPTSVRGLSFCVPSMKRAKEKYKKTKTLSKIGMSS